MTNGWAADFRGAEAITIREGDTLHKDLFAGCRNLNVFGPVMGDIYAGCERVTIEAPIGDDVFAGCREITIKAPVGDNVFAFAQTIYIDNEIGGDLVAFGGDLHLTEKAHVYGNVYLGTGQFFLDGGTVDGKIDGGTGQAYLNGKVGKNVKLETGHVRFDSLYSAGGGTQLCLSKPLDEKSTKFIPPDLTVTVKPHRHFFQRIFFYWLLLSFLVVGILLIAFCKNFSKDYLTFSRSLLWKHMGIGFLILVVTPVIALILIVLLLTLPLGIIMLFLYLIVLYLSYLFAALFVGDWILRSIKKDGLINLFWALLLGIPCVILMTKIPLIGWLLNLAVICFGMGSLIGYIWHEIKPAPSAN